ncbi:MAG TPA: VWA domain-containing protein [Blastocatellia bacterium]|nr:VWA domain-containing protein [Blastocatellia bacterium]
MTIRLRNFCLVILWLMACIQVLQAQSNDDVLKIDTALVTFSVIVSNTNDLYLPDLKKEEFQIFEDGKLQELAFFATIKEPFHVVLMLDTSGSTKEKLHQIQQAANAFVDQLQPADRIKLISFDDEIHDWGNFTNNRSELKAAIADMQPGKGTKLYDAMRVALNNLSRVKGRKAIVLFSDGVDYRSFDTRFDDNMRMLEESSMIVYPIRYDTRWETEELVRQQQAQGSSVVLSDVLKTPPSGTTPTTVPGETRIPAPGSSGRGGVWDRIRTDPPIIVGRRDDRYPDNRYPDNRYPDNRMPDASGRYPDTRFPDSRYPDSGSTNRRSRNDGIGGMLDNLYKTADDYLQQLALKSGGKLHRADTLGSLPEAFANIANELRNQYSLGYYPTNQMRAGKFRKIQVKVARKGAVVRTRPGYREPKS